MDVHAAPPFDLPLLSIKDTEMKILYWRQPSSGIVKLNIDGSCFGNPGEYGGCEIIRDAKGKLVGTFSQYY